MENRRSMFATGFGFIAAALFGRSVEGGWLRRRRRRDCQSPVVCSEPKALNVVDICCEPGMMDPSMHMPTSVKCYVYWSTSLSHTGRAIVDQEKTTTMPTVIVDGTTIGVMNFMVENDMGLTTLELDHGIEIEAREYHDVTVEFSEEVTFYCFPSAARNQSNDSRVPHCT